MSELDFGEISSSRYSEQIADRIEAMIVGNTLRPGDKLPPERVLAESFGVSRSAVREALKLLAERCLVQSKMGNGTYVVDPGLGAVISSISVASRMLNTTIDDLTEVRMYLEVPIAGLAALRATPDDILRIETALRVMDDCTRQLVDPEKRQEMVRADLEFHTALAAATHNPAFTILSNSIFDILLEERAKSQSASAAITEPGHNYHRVILDCVRRGDSAGAQQAMREHLKLHAEVKCGLVPGPSADDETPPGRNNDGAGEGG